MDGLRTRSGLMNETGGVYPGLPRVPEQGFAKGTYGRKPGAGGHPPGADTTGFFAQ